MDRATQMLLAGLVTMGVAVRLLFVGAPGFPSDVGTFMAWAERLAAIGPGSFYEPGYFSDYPRDSCTCCGRSVRSSTAMRSASR